MSKEPRYTSITAALYPYETTDTHLPCVTSCKILTINYGIHSPTKPWSFAFSSGTKPYIERTDICIWNTAFQRLRISCYPMKLIMMSLTTLKPVFLFDRTIADIWVHVIGKMCITDVAILQAILVCLPREGPAGQLQTHYQLLGLGW